MKIKSKKKKGVKKSLLLGLLIFLNFFILFESLIPASLSSQTSMTWTNFFASIAEIFGQDKVEKIEPESIEISGFQTIIIGESKRLTALVLPEEATDLSVSWSSDNEAVAKVTSGGIVVAKDFGSAKITVTSSIDSVFSYIDIQVVDYPLPDSYVLSTEKDSIFVGTTTVIDVTDILPSKASKEYIVWTAEPSNFASVNSYGVVKGLSNGDVLISASCGDFSASIGIHVSTSPDSVISPNSLTISGNSTGYIYRYTQLTADFGATVPTDTSVTWLSSNTNIAKVDKTGKVFGTKFEGLVTITAIANADDSLQDAFEIEMLPVNPTGLTLTASSNSIIAGEKITLTPLFTPEDVTDKELTWTSSDETIAIVSSLGDYGQVLGLKSGEVMISAVSKMDSTISAEIHIEVLKAAVLTPGERGELDSFIRKALGHFALFFIDGVLTLLVVLIFFPKTFIWKQILLSLSVGAFVASLSETFQLFTEGRNGTILDVLLDCLGFFSAVLLTIFVIKLIRKRNARKT